MKAIPLFFMLLFGVSTVFSQENLTEELNKLYDAGEYLYMIIEYEEKIDSMPSEAVYLMGMAHFMEQNDTRCLELMEQAIQKDSTASAAHHMKGVTMVYLNRPEEGIIPIKKAIELSPETSDYHSSLGDCYYQLGKTEKAIEAYQQAIQRENSSDRSFVMLPNLYFELGRKKEALEAFYHAYKKVAKESESYLNIVYNIGLLEMLDSDYDKAEPMFKEVLEIVPDDYHTYAKLIQVYYGKKQYDKAKPYRKKLYQAYEKGELNDDMNEMFCFDQFEWNGQLVQAFERYEESEGELYYKHLFYLLNEKDEIECRIQTENSPVSKELGGKQFLLGMNKGNTHYTFPIGFEADPEYEKLKEAVIDVLEGNVQPMSSSTFKK